jgi:GDP-L-fucose synthase
MSRKVILVTGGTGLVGKALHSIMEDYPNYVFVFLSSLECDLTEYDEILNCFNKYEPEYVIHLAANVGGLYKNLNKKVEMFEQNILMNFNVVKACHMFNVKKCIFALSTCVFPDKVEYPINEKNLHEGPPHSSNEGYAYAKRMLEVHCRMYNEQFGTNYVCIIPTNIYGPNDNFSLEDGQVIPSFIHNCYLAKMNNQPFQIKGSGKALRQFVYSEDLAKLIMIVLETYEKKDSIILSVDEKDEITIKEAAEEIADCFNYHNIEFLTNFSEGQYKKTADNTKMKEFTNFSFTPIKEGLKTTVEWFINNYETCRK